jgi:hypothetical protein
MVGDVEAVEAWVEVSGSVDRIARLRNGKTRVGVPGAGMAHRGGTYIIRHGTQDVRYRDWCGELEMTPGFGCSVASALRDHASES